ncbi:S-adenosyl-L-methionine-dependent methyltransferase,RNA methyltransferase TrmA, active [Cinara cedri]|uniref:tRNA (uracil(54)-C(5))-methyltransferase n=1 Tax=Cinara cedri TaxID=506608 RepID=A0A5E4MBB2_9HEMI|nr:S-adenosyl-L-methionine-dependent methyltransferase,RNA methyltransferase TrmA, active [Cinara cedri]
MEVSTMENNSNDQTEKESQVGTVTKEIEIENADKKDKVEPMENADKKDKVEPMENADKKDKVEPVVKEDPFAYLDRNDFTSEKYKVEVRNLPKYYGIAEFKKLVNQKLKLKCSKVKTPNRNGKWLYVCFRSEEDKDVALGVLNGYNWKNTVLEASNAKAVPDPMVQKRNEQFDNYSDQKRKKLDNIGAEQQMISAVTPLFDIPYEKQLIQKTNFVKKVLLDYGKQLKRTNNSLNLVEWLKKQQDTYDGLPCELLEIKSLKDDIEKCVGYRNKCEFTIGMDTENKEPVVGFRVGSYVQGKTSVASIDKISNVPQRMKNVVNRFQDLVRSSKIPVFDPETYKGHWRQLTVRLSLKTEQLMLICVVHTENMSDTSLTSLKKLILDYFVDGAGSDCKVHSLFFQKAKKKAVGEGNSFPLELLYGKEYIIEEVNGLQVRISPESFFQINTAASELLFSTAKDLASINKKTTVLDICCGSGIIGLSMAKECAQVVGVDIQEDAIKMANINTMENQIKNAKFFAGKAEEIMTLSEFQNPDIADDVVAIVDPPRAGLHNKAILLLRSMKHLNRLVYLSCNPKAALQNFISLSMAKSKTKQGAPFVPVKAIPVDMFPQTPHCELIVYFERYTGN